MACFALIDDPGADTNAPADARPGARLYTGLAGEHRCTDAPGLDALCAAVAADQARGLHAVLLADYEWGAKLQQAAAARRPGDEAAALRVLMFRQRQHLDAAQAQAWLRERIASEAQAEPDAERDADGHRACGVIRLQPSIDRAGFGQAIAAIQTAIAEGQTYQVNYTYRLEGQAYGSPLALYQALRAHQPVRHGALLALPARSAPPWQAGAAGSEPPPAVEMVLSCSPELFLQHRQGLVTARPMKGTAARGAGPEADSEIARQLAGDVKNRAENLMIVDLLRNDLGRVAITGSVQVPALFAVEPYATVFQMTSTVQARLRPGVGLAELLRATFPCGSITGAPKRHTMGLIRQLETTPRGLYCGSIGWLDAPAPGAACGDFSLNVAIRTLTLGAPTARGLRPLRLGVGAGIVQDSRAADEFDECRLKARFLTALDPGFALFETLLCTAGGQLPHLARHLDRLQASAAALGFGLDRGQAQALLLARAATLARGMPHRLRLALRHGGRLLLSDAVLAPLVAAGPAPLLDAGPAAPAVAMLAPPAADGLALPAGADPARPAGAVPVSLRIASQALPLARPLAGHKTTLRARYDAGVREAERHGAFDTLFFDRRGHLVEGGRSSVFVRLDGRWWTPPLSDGALPGVMRALLLDSPAWQAAERSLTRADLQRAEAIVVCNALRGALPARLVQPATAAPADALSA
ncbi:bifunctional chorismate-binding protein/class IV aminotransferase [Aquabacterium sp. OR-4]|uniref:bifunctional chorismate-binding protein/class IV aminotransferase n=1 Tax=Aquabacterium sp. OR-4 TaxID=2978127 RepID=UPI0021B20EB8|nr:bifunctional anthranilate synthase component I family protein/class IV aminotransferase [Aquabacterium sp. OR-4]MDT7838298.1 bifunctional anthranilate synthase component I family protein/class IV aminotransferase [Aquabacterium sp. OR-4]